MKNTYVCQQCNLFYDSEVNCYKCGKEPTLMRAYTDCIKEKMHIENFGYRTVICSIEAVQDIGWRKLDVIRTPDFTDEEVKDWQTYDEFFSKLDIDAAKEKYQVRFIDRDDEPYQDYDW